MYYIETIGGNMEKDREQEIYEALIEILEILDKNDLSLSTYIDEEGNASFAVVDTRSGKVRTVS